MPRLVSASLAVLTVLFAGAAPSRALDRNPDAPVGVFGLSVFFNQSRWGDLKTTQTAVGSPAVSDEDPDAKENVSRFGLSALVPAHDRVTIRGSLSRGLSRAEDTELVTMPGGDTLVTFEQDMNAWEFGASVTVWIGNASR